MVDKINDFKKYKLKSQRIIEVPFVNVDDYLSGLQQICELMHQS
jgi:hypothetical protein